MKLQRPFDLALNTLGHYCPERCPRAASQAMGDLNPSDELGAPLNIHEVARLIGCSAWTVRQRHLPRGLPHFRSGPSGRLIFYRTQVVRWILENQQKGGRRL